MLYRWFVIFVSLILFAAGQLGAQTCRPAPVGLVSWWSADGNTLEARFRNNGTLTPGAAFVAGQNGQGFSFVPGSDMNADGSGSLNITGDKLTIEAWIKLENNVMHPARDFSAFIGKNNFPTENFAIIFESGLIGGAGGRQLAADEWQFEYIITNNLDRRIHNQRSGVIARVDGNYHHFTLTYNGSLAPNNTVKLFIDGVSLSAPVTSPIDQINGPLKSSPGVPFSIASIGTSNSVSIDEVSVYDRVLSNSEIAAIAAAGTAGKCKPTATVAPNGLVGWWAGDGNSNDTAGTNNGTLQNGAGFAIGKAGQAFGFDGVDDFIDVANSSSLNFGTGNFSIESWVKFNDLTQGQTILDKTIGNFPNSQTYALEFIAPDQLRFLIHDTTANENDLLAIVSMQTDVWYHIAAVRQGNTVLVYLDGVLIGQQTAGNNINTGTGGALRIGRSSEVASGFFNGEIDELSIYSRDLTGAEIASIFNAGVAGKLKQAATATGFAPNTAFTASMDTAEIGYAKDDAGVRGLSPEAVNTSVGDVAITFPGVTAAGTTQQIPLPAGALPPLPSGNPTGLVYDVATSAIFTGSPDVCFNLPTFGNSIVFSNLRVMHLESGLWQNRTTSSDFSTRTLCSRVTSLSPFAIVDLTPTAAAVSVSGRVTSQGGTGLARVHVMIQGGNLPHPVHAYTNTFGYYRLEGIEVGHTYVVSVVSRRYVFPEPSRVLLLTDEVADVDFIADSP